MDCGSVSVHSAVLCSGRQLLESRERCFGQKRFWHRSTDTVCITARPLGLFSATVRTGTIRRSYSHMKPRHRKQSTVSMAYRNNTKLQDGFDRFIQRLPGGVLKETLELYQDLIRRVAVTVFVVAIIRLGTSAPLPTLGHLPVTTQERQQMLTFIGFGGLFHLGISPHIFAGLFYTLVMNFPILIPSAYKRFDELRNTGLEGYYKIKLLLSWIGTGAAFAMGVWESFGLGPMGAGAGFVTLTALYMTAGASVLHYLSDIISEYGIGEGTTWVLCLSVITAYRVVLQAAATYVVQSALPWWRLAAAAGVYALLIAGMTVVDSVQLRVPMVYYRTKRTKPSMASALTPVTELLPSDNSAASRLASPSSAYIPLRATNGLGSLLYANILLDCLVAVLPVLIPPVRAAISAATSDPWCNAFMFSIVVFLCDFCSLSLGESNMKTLADYLVKIEAGIDGISPGGATEKFLAGKAKQFRFWGALMLAIIVFAARAADRICFGPIGAHVGTMLLLIVSLVASTSRQVYSLVQAPKVAQRLSKQRRALESAVSGQATMFGSGI